MRKSRKRGLFGFRAEFYFWILMVPSLIALLILDIILFFKYRALVDQEAQNQVAEVVEANANETSIDTAVNAVSADVTVQLPSTAEMQAIINEDIPGIVCWGDSLTAGKLSMASYDSEVPSYPYKLENMIRERITSPLDGGTGELSIPVYNKGISGESSLTICGRSGSIPYVLSEKLEIPATTDLVKIHFKSSRGNKPVAPIRTFLINDQDVREGETAQISIDGIKGTLSIVQEHIMDPNYEYYFSRNEEGEEKTIEAGAPIVFEYDVDYKECIPVIYFGTNGIFDDDNDLLEQIDSIINIQSEKIKGKYIVIGLHYGGSLRKNKDEMLALDNKMKERYKEHYISIIDSMCDEEALKAVGITELSDEDREQIANKDVPGCIVADKELDIIHFKDAGYTLIANKVYARMDELGYFDRLKQIASN